MVAVDAQVTEFDPSSSKSVYETLQTLSPRSEMFRPRVVDAPPRMFPKKIELWMLAVPRERFSHAVVS